MVSLFTRSSAPKLKPSRSDLSTASAADASTARDGQLASSARSPSLTDVSGSSSNGAQYIADESHLSDEVEDPAETPNLRELNNCLEALFVVFPDVQVEVFREMLTSFDGESRLALVADALLKNRVQWVKGRWRTADGNLGGAADRDAKILTRSKGAAAASTSDIQVGIESEKAIPNAVTHTPDPRLVPTTEVFRSTSYKKSVRALALQEFRGLSKSTIDGVLAESNYAYLEARRTLVQLSSKSWRFAISSFLLRRKTTSVTPSEAENHPLVVWRSTGRGSIVPAIRSTGSADLDRELFDALVRPLVEKSRKEAEERDRSLAQYLNNEEAAEMDQTHECACCFTDGAFEEFTSCSVEGHMLCFKCIQRMLQEAVFGQGWSNVDVVTGTLKCPAMAGDGCTGRITADHLQRAILDLPNGVEVLNKFDRRLAEHSILKANMPLVRCPFCDYAEIDDIFLPSDASPLRIRADSIYNLIFMMLCVGTIPFVMPIIVLSTLACLILSSAKEGNVISAQYVASEWAAALSRHHRRRRGARFACHNRPACGRASCLSCQKPWTDMHVCNESSLVSLRTQVEQAMSLVVKRVCPLCGTSFVKTQGCNKLTCPCGYKMCYVCRADIGQEGYRHFCDHFRPDGDPDRQCQECARCNLWETEDTERLLREAKEEAERRWREEEKRELSGEERVFLETGFLGDRRAVAKGGNVLRLVSGWRVPRLGEVFDVVVETVFF